MADLEARKLPIPRSALLHYVDEMFAIEREALAVSNLLIGIIDLEVIDHETLSEVGAMFKNFFNRQRLLRHHFFGEKFGHEVDEDYAAGEIERLKRKYREEDESED